MRWVATYRGEPAFNKTDGLFNIDRIRKIGTGGKGDDDSRYFSVVIRPEGYVIYETYLGISPRPSGKKDIREWKEQYEALAKKILLDVITELGTPRSEQEIVDLMQRFGFSGP